MTTQAYVVTDKENKPLRIFSNAFEAIGWVESYTCEHKELVGEVYKSTDKPDKWYMVYKDLDTRESLLSIRECYY